jgi:hypothetical protein
MPKPKFNVMDYASGQAIGNCTGTTPDGSAAFQAAFDAAIAASGGTVYIPEGSYCIGTTISESSNTPFAVNIEGDAQQPVQIKWTRAPTIAGVAITGAAGQFSCSCSNVKVGDSLIISGTLGGTGSISGYVNPAIYYISATNGTSTFTLQTPSRTAIATTTGTPTGLTYNVQPSLFYFAQWNSSHASHVYISSTVPYLVGFDVDSNATNNQGGESLSFRNISFVDSSPGAVGFRFGETPTGNGDFSFENFENANCQFGNGTNTANTVCFLNLRQDGLNWNWYGGHSYHACYAYSATPQYNGQNQGGGSMSFFGFGTSGTTCFDFYFQGNSTNSVFGGRFELGSAFIQTSGGANRANVVVVGAELGGYAAANYPIALNSAGSVELIDVNVSGSTMTSGIVDANPYATGSALNIGIRGGTFQTSQPLINIASTIGNTRYSIKNAAQTDSTGALAVAQIANIESDSADNAVNTGTTSDTLAAGKVSTYESNNTASAAFTLTLAAPAADQEVRRVCFKNATGTITYAVTSPATAASGLATTLTAGACIAMKYNATSGVPANAPATTWIPY